jgi:hypothetical protein
LIRVTCAECGEEFEIGDDFAGITEFCPACGALNDIPSSEPQEDEAPPATTLPFAVDDAERPRSGIPARLWWTIFVGAVSLFIAACVFLFSDTWESRNVQALSDATNRGDDFLADDDYADAMTQYRFVLDTVGHRKIESGYIGQLVDRARHGIVDAEARQKPAPAVTPAPAVASATRVSPATQPESQVHFAMTTFQRNSEAFGRFMRDHPTVFRDRDGAWRRRRYVVWDEDYDEPALKEPLRVGLRFNVGSQITVPHFSRQDAEADDNFVHDESPGIVQCQTFFLWTRGQWFIERHDVGAQKEPHVMDDVRPSLDDFFVLERQAFGAMQK